MAADGVLEGLRRAGFDGERVLIGAEPHMPYDRTALSKDLLAGRRTARELALHPPRWYEATGARCLLGARAAELVLDQQQVVLDTGAAVDFDVVVVATGSRPRRLRGFPHAVALRELADLATLEEGLSSGDGINIIGGGFVATEVASVLRERGLGVTIYARRPHLLEHIVGEDVGRWLAELHCRHGVDVRTGVEPPPGLAAPVLVSVGTDAQTELVEAVVDTSDGVLVDEFGHTSAADVYACGDVARFKSTALRTDVRVEHFQTAWRQGLSVGMTIAGSPTPFNEVPWCWTRQYEYMLHYAGARVPWERTLVYGRTGCPPFGVFYVTGDTVVGVLMVMGQRAFRQVREAWRHGPLTVDALADMNLDGIPRPA